MRKTTDTGCLGCFNMEMLKKIATILLIPLFFLSSIYNLFVLMILEAGIGDEAINLIYHRGGLNFLLIITSFSGLYLVIMLLNGLKD